MNIYGRVLLVIGAFAIGVMADRFFSNYFATTSSSLINPVLQLEDKKSSHLRQSEIQDLVEKSISEAIRLNSATSIAVYFRDLRGGPTFGVNEDTAFVPASLLKVPVMIDYFKRLKSDPLLLSKLIVYDPSKHDILKVSPLLEAPEALVPGNAYSVDYLIQRMITQSDNTSANMLARAPGADIGLTLKDMGVRLTEKDGQVWLTVKDYAGIFRILYNGQYLTPEMSARALDLLTQCQYREGLPKLLPSPTVIAHKFGERTLGDVSQFHDCGIVYHPARPYLLCVMSRGRSMEKLVSVVAEISKTVFDHISNIP